LKFRILGIIAFLILGAVIGFLQPFAPALAQQGHLTLMAVVMAVGLWIFGNGKLPMTVGAMLMLLIFVLAGLKNSLIFNGFTGRAIWILIPVLYFGFALSKTGLGKRLAYWVIRLFKPGYFSLAIAWVIIGVLLSILTPSGTVRIVIVVPIAASMIEICRIQHGSRGAGFIMLVAWMMCIIPGSAWLTGSLNGPMALGFFGAVPGLENIITGSAWFKAMFVPTFILAILVILGLFRFMKPVEKLNVPRDVFVAEYNALGPISRSEIAVLVILLVTFVLLVTAQFTLISEIAICMGAFALLAVCGVIGIRDIGPGINWDFVLFLATVMGLATIFKETGVSAFLSSTFAPGVNALAFSPWVLLPAAALALFAWRFLEVAQLLPTIPFLVPFLPGLLGEHGVHPLVMYLVFIMASNFFIMSYQQPFAILGESLSGKSGWTAGQLRQAGLIYTICCVVTLLVSIPYWMVVGFIK
jgi:di/tricarboxylate transporter